MSWTQILLIVSIATIAQPYSLSANESSVIISSTTPPRIVSPADDQKFVVQDRFKVRPRVASVPTQSIDSLFPQADDAANSSPHPGNGNEIVHSTKSAQSELINKPKLTVIVRSENEPRPINGDAVADEEIVQPPPVTNLDDHQRRVTRQNRHTHSRYERHRNDSHRRRLRRGVFRFR